MPLLDHLPQVDLQPQGDSMTGKTANLHPELVDILTRLQGAMGFELNINSGHRDPEHNDKVGGVADSEHTYSPAEGADVLCKQGITRYKMLKWLLTHDIRRIGIGEEFIHIGIAEDKPQFVVWHYYPKKKV